MKPNFGDRWRGKRLRESTNKYLSFLIRRPSSAFLRWKFDASCEIIQMLLHFFLGNARCSGRAGLLRVSTCSGENQRRKTKQNPIITPRKTTENNFFSWMILKPILKVINNHGERMLKIIVIIFVGDLVICLLLCFLLLLFLLKTEEQQQKNNHQSFYLFCYLCPRKIGKTLESL